MPVALYKDESKDYWHLERKGKKLGTIFIYLVIDAFAQDYSIFENHF